MSEVMNVGVMNVGQSKRQTQDIDSISRDPSLALYVTMRHYSPHPPTHVFDFHSTQRHSVTTVVLMC